MPTPPPATTAEFLTLVRRTGLLAEVPSDLPDPSDLPATFSIDYVRIWQRAELS